MLNFSEIISLIKHLENLKKDTQVAKILGVTIYKLSMWKRRNTIPTEILLKYSMERNISLNYILSGKTSSQLLSKATGCLNTSPPFYIDPKDEIIIRLEAENRHLRKICDSIKSIILEEHKDSADRRSGRKKGGGRPRE